MIAVAPVTQPTSVPAALSSGGPDRVDYVDGDTGDEATRPAGAIGSNVILRVLEQPPRQSTLALLPWRRTDSIPMQRRGMVRGRMSALGRQADRIQHH